MFGSSKNIKRMVSEAIMEPTKKLLVSLLPLLVERLASRVLSDQISNYLRCILSRTWYETMLRKILRTLVKYLHWWNTMSFTAPFTLQFCAVTFWSVTCIRLSRTVVFLFFFVFLVLHNYLYNTLSIFMLQGYMNDVNLGSWVTNSQPANFEWIYHIIPL